MKRINVIENYIFLSENFNNKKHVQNKSTYMKRKRDK